MKVVGLIIKEFSLRIFYFLFSLFSCVAFFVDNKNILVSSFFYFTAQNNSTSFSIYFSSPLDIFNFYIYAVLCFSMIITFPYIALQFFVFFAASFNRCAYFNSCFLLTFFLIAYFVTAFICFFYFFPLIINFLFSFVFESSPIFSIQYLPSMLPVFFFLSNFIITMFFFFQTPVFLLFFVKQKRVSFANIGTQRKNCYFFYA